MSDVPDVDQCTQAGCEAPRVGHNDGGGLCVDHLKALISIIDPVTAEPVEEETTATIEWGDTRFLIRGPKYDIELMEDALARADTLDEAAERVYTHPHVTVMSRWEHPVSEWQSDEDGGTE